MTSLEFRVAAALLCISGLLPSIVHAQGVTEWSSEIRTSLNFKVNEAALQKLLPAGWAVAPSTAPGNRGGNVNMTMMERQLVLDPQGRLLGTGTQRYVVLTVAAKNAAGENSTIAVAGISPDAPGSYGVYLPATVSKLDRSTSGGGLDSGRGEEHWEFVASSGERIDVRLAYRRQTATRSRGETKVRSAKTPVFTRTYKIEQSSDVLRSLNTPDRVEHLEFRASGGVLASLFDGSETLLTVTSTPYYVREISIP